jgi:4-hydroxyphenylacetate 3-monooxygenase oxygenase component
MTARTGTEFLAGLRDSREVWLGSDRADDVTTDPALSGAARALAGLFDLQHERPAECLMPDSETGEQINASHMIPRSRADVIRRHAVLRAYAEYSAGIMGRSPDYMNVTFAGFAGAASVWGANGNGQGAENLIRFQKELRRRDLCLTHTIIHPTTDRAMGDAPKPGNEISLHKVGETSDGIIVRGARILATLAPFADETAVYPSHPISPGAEEFALAFSISMATPGLKVLCRDSYSLPMNSFDHPISSRFDEQDAFLIFDDVVVPHERIFIDGNLEVYNSAMATSWGPNIMQQTCIRAHAKLQFAHELGTRMAEALNDTRPATLEMLGEIWTYSEFARSAIRTAEEEAHEYADDAWFPDVRPLAALRASLPQWFPRVNEILQLIGSHNLLAVASEAMLADVALRPHIDHYMKGAGTTTAEDRSRLFRLAWDFTGSALANRVELYERFYLASGPRNMQSAQRVAMAGRAEGARMVENLMRAEG